MSRFPIYKMIGTFLSITLVVVPPVLLKFSANLRQPLGS
jgi:hypothetical protein